MKGDPAIIELLNEVLTAELTAINQYFIHAKMCENWGYKRLAEQKRKESIEEMKDAQVVIERILYLDGLPNMQRLNPVRVGEDAVEQHKQDLALETEASLWILDEPYDALDVDGVACVNALLRENLARGGSVLLTSHQATGDAAPPMAVFDLDPFAA